jgi:hypothetical protein
MLLSALYSYIAMVFLVSNCLPQTGEAVTERSRLVPVHYGPKYIYCQQQRQSTNSQASKSESLCQELEIIFPLQVTFGDGKFPNQRLPYPFLLQGYLILLMLD